MKALLIFLCFISPAITLSAQDGDFKSGSYVDHRGDSVKGYISWKGQGDSILKFKRDLQTLQYATVPCDSTKSIHLEGDSYTFWYGKRSMTMLDPFEFRILNIDSFATANIPLKLLFAGKRFSLYNYRDITDHFFIGYDGKIEELIIRFRYLTAQEHAGNFLLIHQPEYTIFPVYRDQILAIMKNQVSNKQRSILQTTEYTSHNLIRLFKALDK